MMIMLASRAPVYDRPGATTSSNNFGCVESSTQASPSTPTHVEVDIFDIPRRLGRVMASKLGGNAMQVAFGLVFLAVLYGASRVPVMTQVIQNTGSQKTCLFPGVSSVLARCRVDEMDPLPDFRKLVQLQVPLQVVMEGSAKAQEMAVNIKHSEMAVRDLIALVNMSRLVAKESLAQNLVQFIKDAKSAGRGLQKLSCHVGRIIDQTVATNELAIETLENAAEQEDSGMTLFSQRSSRQDCPQETWLMSVSTLKTNVQELMAEATLNLRALDALENQRYLIHSTIPEGRNKPEKDQSKMLSQLWTTLARDNDQLAQLKSHASLLDDVIKGCDEARKHVADTLLQLQKINADLEVVSEQVPIRPLDGKASAIPLKVHISDLRRGTDRLSGGRLLERDHETGYKHMAPGGSR
ncbi:hypothetical protein RhiJN_09876 [Ceratobasidium sp. AG-Ba]|nr:hypothetical protein RhiJN_09876 [Ceratobasidium sp. AG-Ba]